MKLQKENLNKNMILKMLNNDPEDDDGIYEDGDIIPEKPEEEYNDDDYDY